MVQEGIPPEATANTTSESTKDAGKMPERKFLQRIATHKKVKIRCMKNEDEAQYNGKNGQIKDFDPETGHYHVKVVILAEQGKGLLGTQETILFLRYENIELHQDQVEKDRLLTGDEIVLLGAGDAKRSLYETRLDPQYWYDKAIERVFEAKNDFEVLDLPVQLTEDLSILKRQYRKISLAVHPDKNSHPQATDAFRKVYGAFETLMDLKQQRRMLWILGKLNASQEEQITFEEDEEDELFQWWWEASVPQMEKQAAEVDGQHFDDFGAMWISDGLGGDVDDVKWVGLETAKRLHKNGEAIFIDCRDRVEFSHGHIQNAWNSPLPEWIQFGLTAALDTELISQLVRCRNKVVIIYSEVATPFSRCRATCRWLLRAGHKTLSAKRLRRLRGGVFGWKHKGGPLSHVELDQGRLAIDASKKPTKHTTRTQNSIVGG